MKLCPNRIFRAMECQKSKRFTHLCGLWQVLALLKYCNTFSLRSTFSEFAMKYGKDNRFKGIEKMKDRESLFTEFMAELKKKEKESVKLKQDKVGSFVPLGRHVRGTCSLLGERGGGKSDKST